MRIREIKPAFWDNEELADISLGARLMFIGLWQIADRAGFFHDRPRKIRAELFPFAVEPEAPIVEWLGELESAGMIRRFESEKVWHICQFEKHQRPHPKERASKFKHLVEKSREKVRSGREKDEPCREKEPPDPSAPSAPSATSAPMGDGGWGDSVPASDLIRSGFPQVIDPEQLAAQLRGAFPKLDIGQAIRKATIAAKSKPPRTDETRYLLHFCEKLDENRVINERKAAKATGEQKEWLRDIGHEVLG